MREGIHTEEELMYGVRRAMMGKAGEKITRMGPGMTVEKLISSFESEYGYVDTKESVLGKLFNCKQGIHELCRKSRGVVFTCSNIRRSNARRYSLSTKHIIRRT